VAPKASWLERIPIVALVVTAVFALEVLVLSSASLSTVTAALFWGLAIGLAPLMQETSMGDASTTVQMVVLVGVLFIVLAFLETAVIIILRKATPRVRWIVRGSAGVIAIGLLLFTPSAGPMRMF
jgi:hypothetical protein